MVGKPEALAALFKALAYRAESGSESDMICGVPLGLPVIQHQRTGIRGPRSSLSLDYDEPTGR